MRLGQKLLEDGAKYADGFNFGPEMNKDVRVAEVAEYVAKVWGDGQVKVGKGDGLHEANLLQLNVEKADKTLGVRPVYTAHEAIEKTTAWYQAFYNKKTDMHAFSLGQIADFIAAAQHKNLPWSK